MPIYPGQPTAEAVEDDGVVVLDLTSLAYPADGIIPGILRAIGNTDLAYPASVIMHNRTSAPTVPMALAELARHRSIAAPLAVTLPHQAAEDLYEQLGEALGVLNADPCAYPGCHRRATADEWCGPHHPERGE